MDEISTNDRKISEWQDRNKMLIALSARAKIFLSTSEHAKSFTVVYSAAIPRSFRIEVLTPFGQTIAVLSANGEKIYAINLNENICFSSELNNESLKKFVPFNINPEVITNILVTRIPYFENSAPELNSEDNVEYVFSYENDGKIYTISFWKSGPLKVSGSTEDLTYNFEKFERVENILVPTKVTITDGSSYSIIELSDVLLNSRLERSDFELVIPDSCVLTEGGIF